MPTVPPPEKGWPPLPGFSGDRHKETGGGLWDGLGASPVGLTWSHEGPETTFLGPVWDVLGSVRVGVRKDRGPRPVLGLHLRPPEAPVPSTGLGQPVFAEPCAGLSTARH